MPEEYESLVTDLKALTQTEGEGQGAQTVTLPMAEDEWYTRPDTVSYGTVRLDFEADALHGDNRKEAIAYEGSVDLFSLVKNGAGWVELITQTLEEHCEGCWSLNAHMYERDTGLFHWEWTFQVEG
jgi:hypothetical protein